MNKLEKVFNAYGHEKCYCCKLCKQLYKHKPCKGIFHNEVCHTIQELYYYLKDLERVKQEDE